MAILADESLTDEEKRVQAQVDELQAEAAKKRKELEAEQKRLQTEQRRLAQLQAWGLGSEESRPHRKARSVPGREARAARGQSCEEREEHRNRGVHVVLGSQVT